LAEKDEREREKGEIHVWMNVVSSVEMISVFQAAARDETPLVAAARRSILREISARIIVAMFSKRRDMRKVDTSRASCEL